MQPLESIDINFKVNTDIKKNDICFYSVLQTPFSIHGVHYDDGKFRRMPEKIAKTVNPGVHYLHSNTSGGRVRFKTNSKYIAISTKLANVGKMDHFALTGSAGFDLFVDNHFVTSFRPPFDIEDSYQSIHEFTDGAMRDILINFPLYSDVCQLYIGLQKDADVDAPTPYGVEKPVVFYGSSITQGGCASRPGNSYPAILSRWFDFDFVNLGFSGNAKGEQEIARYIADLEMGMFVLDYDHNAPDLAHLQKTHYAFYETVRAAHPHIPIIMMSSITMPWTQDHYFERRDTICNSYCKAREQGDETVYFWDGSKEFSAYADYGTVEGSHPNDYGFHGMAEGLRDLFTQLLAK